MKKNQKIIAGNWKMNPIKREKALEIVAKTQASFAKYKNLEVIICPPYVYLPIVGDKIKASKAKHKISLGAQNFFKDPTGSFTGEISADMLPQFGTKYIIVGHSERRTQGETDSEINKKILHALSLKLKPIVCIGEHKRDEDGQYLSLIKQQIELALAHVPEKALSSIVIAYEPVWAIGASQAMSPYEVHQMTIFIKKMLFEFYRSKSVSVPILYGGSVDTSNAGEILKDGEADGLLIGRQSLDPVTFNEILSIASTI